MSVWQTGKVYAAEDSVGNFGELLSVAEAEEFMAKIRRSVWWKNRCKVENVRLVILGDRANGEPELGALKESWKRGILFLTARMLYKSMIVHEMAHILTWPGYRKPTHAPDFAGAYLHLARVWTSKEHAERLERAFSEKGVEWVTV